MKFLEWFKPGVGIKRWFLLGIVGILLISFGINLFFTEDFGITRIFYFFLGGLLIVGGGLGIYLAFKNGMQTVFNLMADTSPGMNGLDASKLSKLMFEKRILVKGPKIVVIGGGTGLSVMLRGLKHYTSNITAVVTVADDGGGSGKLRQDMGILPPGDIRNCILALANMEPIMEKLFQYRFKEGDLKGQSFGNLLIAAMSDVSNGFEEAIQQISNVLAVTGRVLPVTLEDVTLVAELEDGTKIEGESQIPIVQGERNSRISRVLIQPQKCKPLPEVLEAIREADAIVLGPGSLYTSIIPNLLINGVADAIRHSQAIKIYVANVMTQRGETQKYTVRDHIEAIQKHAGEGLIQYALVNDNLKMPKYLLEKYFLEGAEPVDYDSSLIQEMGIHLIEKDMLKVSDNLLRHSSKLLAEAIVELVSDVKLSADRVRLLDYYFINERIKKYRKVKTW